MKKSGLNSAYGRSYRNRLVTVFMWFIDNARKQINTFLTHSEQMFTSCRTEEFLQKAWNYPKIIMFLSFLEAIDFRWRSLMCLLPFEQKLCLLFMTPSIFKLFKFQIKLSFSNEFKFLPLPKQNFFELNVCENECRQNCYQIKTQMHIFSFWNF